MIGTELPAGVEHQRCQPCRGTGANSDEYDGICLTCYGVGRVAVDTETGERVSLVECGACRRLARMQDTTWEIGTIRCRDCLNRPGDQ